MPSDDGLKLSQFARIVQACGNLLACEIGKLSQNLRGSFASGQVTQHEAHGNACSRNPRFSTENFRVAHDVLFPWHGHAPILSPFPGNRKSQFLTFPPSFCCRVPHASILRVGGGVCAPPRFQPFSARNTPLLPISRSLSKRKPRYPAASKQLTSNH